MNDSLKAKTLKALMWISIEYVLGSGSRFLIGIVLARLLFPEQFGLIGMLSIFIAVAQVMMDSGFGAALIQKKEITHVHTSSIFYFNIFIGFLGTAIIYLIAPWVAAFYNQPLLEPITRVFSIRIIIDSFAVIHYTILQKNLDFKTQTKAGIISGTGSGLIGIFCAASGFEVWSLVIQQISSSLLRAICLWSFNTWRPSFDFKFSALRELFAFGSKLLLTDLISQIFENIYQLVIGKFFSASDLGYFTRAKTLNELPSQTLSSIIGHVLYPAFSLVQDDKERLRRAVKKILTILALVNCPLMIGLAVIARPLVIVILTEKWLGCITYFQLFCIVGLVGSLNSINVNVIIALGRSDIYLKIEIIRRLLVICNIVVTFNFGIAAMICGMIIENIIIFSLTTTYTKGLIGYSILEQLRDIMPYFSLAILMATIISALKIFPISSNWHLLFIQIFAGILSYIYIFYIFKRNELIELKKILLEHKFNF